MRLLYSTILLSVAFIFVSCQEENNGLRSPEREKAEAWAQAARELFWGEDRTLNLDTLPDVTPVVAMMDSAIALDPQNRQYYYQKAEYLALAEEVDALSAVFRQLAALGEDKTPFLPETLGQCFARKSAKREGCWGKQKKNQYRKDQCPGQKTQACRRCKSPLMASLPRHGEVWCAMYLHGSHQGCPSRNIWDDEFEAQEP